ELRLLRELARRRKYDYDDGDYDPARDSERIHEHRIERGARGGEHREEAGRSVERTMADHSGPYGAGTQTHPAEEHAPENTADGHEHDTRDIHAPEVVTEQNERRMPDAPDRTAHKQCRPDPEWAKRR